MSNECWAILHRLRDVAIQADMNGVGHIPVKRSELQILETEFPKMPFAIPTTETDPYRERLGNGVALIYGKYILIEDD